MQICSALYKRQKPSHIVVYIFLLCSIFCSTCSKGPDFARAYGSTTKVMRELNGIQSLSVGEKFKIYITQDTSKVESIEITYGSNLIEGIQTAVNQGQLTISDNNHFNWVRDLDYFPLCTLNVHRLDQIIARGSSQINCLDTLTNGLDFHVKGVGTHSILINAGQVTGDCTGPGHVIFKGWGGILAWTCENAGWIDAKDMACADAYIYHYTVQDLYVNPGTILHAELYNKGNVYYFRNPTYSLEKAEYGEGRLLKK